MQLQLCTTQATRELSCIVYKLRDKTERYTVDATVPERIILVHVGFMLHWTDIDTI